MQLEKDICSEEYMKNTSQGRHLRYANQQIELHFRIWWTNLIRLTNF
jgi:hypothetical protein